MQPTNFSKYLTNFLTHYLAHQRGVSANTITSYRDTFVLLIHYLESTGVKFPQLTLEKINKDAVVGFLEWLQTKRENGNATRNVRLAALHSLYRYLQYQHPEHLHHCQQILAIPMKKAEHAQVNYLSLDGITLLLQLPDTATAKGRRDLALLSLMYDTGARVQEMIDLTPSCIRFEAPSTIKVTGKGKKTRIIPMLEAQVLWLRNYMQEHQLTEPGANLYPLFCNSRGEKLTRAGINHILLKYVAMAKPQSPQLFPGRVSCHAAP